MTLAEVVEADDGQASTTRRRILVSAVDIIESRGEAALRMADVARSANVAIGLVGHYFGGRDGLVAAAQAERFRGSVVDDLARLNGLIAGRPSTPDVLASLSELTRELVGTGRRNDRLARVAALGAAHGRPELHERLGATSGDMLDVFSAIVSLGQQQGYVRRDLDPRAVATLIQGYAIGLVIADIDPRPASPDALTHVIEAALSCLFVATPDPTDSDS